MHTVEGLTAASAGLGGEGLPESERLGRTLAEGWPVHLSPELGASLNMSPATAIVGGIGSGKTVVAAALATRLASSERSPGAALVVSPRGGTDYEYARDQLVVDEQVSDRFYVDKLGWGDADTEYGVDNSGFSIWEMLENGRRTHLARGLLALIVRLLSDTGREASDPEWTVSEAVAGRVAGEVAEHGAPAPGFRLPYLKEVARELKNESSDTEQRNAAASVENGLDYHLDNDFPEPAVSMLAEGLPRGCVEVEEGRVKVCAADGLPLPPSHLGWSPEYKVSISEHERLSVGAMLVALAGAQERIYSASPSGRKIPVWLVVEEPGLYSLLEGGEEVLLSIIREGRSLNVGTVLVASSAKELEPYVPLLTTWLIGRHIPSIRGEGWNGLEYALDAARVSYSEESRDLDVFSRLSPGEFLVSRCDNAAGFVQVERP